MKLSYEIMLIRRTLKRLDEQLRELEEKIKEKERNENESEHCDPLL